MSAWMPAPPLESEPATMSSRAGFKPPPQSCCDFLDGAYHIIDHGAQQRFVFAFGHDADHGLGARFAHEQTPRTVQPSLAVLDAGRHARISERRALLETDIFHHL